MSKYPNLEALAQGCISGFATEWVRLRPEAEDVLAEIERLREQLESATYALQAWKNESDRLQASRDAYRHVAIEWYSAEGPFPENFSDADIVCDVDTKAEWRSASAGKGE